MAGADGTITGKVKTASTNTGQAPVNTISKISTYNLAKPVVNTDLTERFIFSNLPRK